VSDFSADTAPEVFEEAGCAICGKLIPVCEMEELSNVENINLLKVDGVTRKFAPYVLNLWKRKRCLL
jgi:hypothetical protein